MLRARVHQISKHCLRKGCLFTPSEAGIGGRVPHLARYTSTKDGPEVTKDRWEEADIDPSSRPHRVLRREDIIKKAMTEKVGDAGPQYAKEIPPTESDGNYAERRHATKYGAHEQKPDELNHRVFDAKAESAAASSREKDEEIPLTKDRTVYPEHTANSEYYVQEGHESHGTPDRTPYSPASGEQWEELHELQRQKMVDAREGHLSSVKSGEDGQFAQKNDAFEDRPMDSPTAFVEKLRTERS